MKPEIEFQNFPPKSFNLVIQIVVFILWLYVYSWHIFLILSLYLCSALLDIAGHYIQTDSILFGFPIFHQFLIQKQLLIIQKTQLIKKIFVYWCKKYCEILRKLIKKYNYIFREQKKKSNFFFAIIFLFFMGCDLILKKSTNLLTCHFFFRNYCVNL